MNKKLIIGLLAVALVLAIGITAALYIAIPYLTDTAVTTTNPIRNTTKRPTDSQNPVEDPIHVHTEVIDEEVLPTCAAPGLSKGKHCSTCGKVISAQKEIPMLDHTYDDENDKKCNVCGYVRDDDCDHLELVVMPAVDPTCTVIGLTEGQRCVLCNATVVKQDIIDLIDHIPGEWIIDKEPTKTENGLMHNNCIMCGELLEEKDIPATGSLGLKYTLNPDGKSYNVSIGTCEDTDIVILAEYKDKPVTHIAEYGFYNCDWIVSVYIPDSIIDIDDYAFRYCTSLESIELPDSVARIGRSSFRYCTSLASVSFGDGVEHIGEDAFYKCVSLESVELPNSVATVEPGAFAECTLLTSIEVDENNKHYKSIDGNLYSKDEDALVQYAVGKQDTSFTVPSSVEHIGDFAFRGCSALTDVEIPTSVTSIGSGAFYNCVELVNVEIPKSVTSIGHSVFRNCISLVSVELPAGVKSIGDASFYKCSSLVSISIPDSVTSIGDSAFYECVALVDISIPDKVTLIGDNAFFKCISLTGTMTMNGVVSIGDGAFYKCVLLEGVVLGDDVTSIGDYAFYKCTSLASVEISDGLTSIGDSAFADCNSLSSIKYNGNVNQWNAIGKGTYWNHNIEDVAIEFVVDEESK